MKPEDVMKRMTFLQSSVNEAKNAASESEKKQLEEINKAIEDLKAAYDNESENPEVATPEGTGDKQLDRVVECPVGVAPLTDVSSEQPVEEPTSVIMDEIIDEKDLIES